MINKSEQALNNYMVQSIISAGQFSTVYKAVYVPNQTIVAIKAITKTDDDFHTSELEVMTKINHPLIVSLYEIIETSSHFYIVMEFVDGMTLLQYLQLKGQNMNELMIRHIFCEVLSCLYYLHEEMHIIHRDLKLENIMIDKYNNIRLVDFGFSKIHCKCDILHTQCGSLNYLAPEILKKQQYSFKVDVWSFGVIGYALLFKTFPFHDDNLINFYNKVTETEPYYSLLAPKGPLNIVKRCLTKDPQNRPSIEELLDDPFISGSTNMLLLNKKYDESKEFLIDITKSNPQIRMNKKAHVIEGMNDLFRSCGCVKALKVNQRSAPKIYARKRTYPPLLNTRKRKCISGLIVSPVRNVIPE